MTWIGSLFFLHIMTHMCLCADIIKDNFLTQARFDPKLFYPKKRVDYHKSEFAIKQREMGLTTSISKTRLPHLYRGNNYVINFICSPFKSKSKNIPN